MDIRWPGRMFVDGYVKYPTRYNFKDLSGNITGIYDLDFAYGEVYEFGTNANTRGYWQPIEDYLAEYNSQPVSDQISTVTSKLNAKFLTLNNRADSVYSAANTRADAVNTTANTTATSAYARVTTKINAMESAVTIKITALETRIYNAENSLVNYAPKSGAAFTNPQLNVIPPAATNSQLPATTRWVRDYVQTFAFPPKNVKNLSVTPGGLMLTIKWTDPIDFVYDSMLLSEWAGTKIVYRTDRYPNNETDGTLVVDNQYRNWYASTGFELDVFPGTTYYIQAFPYSTKNTYNRHTANRFNTIKIPSMQILTPLSVARWQMATATDGAGKVWFSGGSQIISGIGASSPVIDIYDTAGNRTTLNQGLIPSRYGAASASDGLGYVLIGGGYNSDTGSSSVVEKYSPSLSRNVLAPLSAPRYELASSRDGAGSVLYLGGNSSAAVDKYTSSGSHSVLTPLSQARGRLAAAIDGNGKVLAIGGYAPSGPSNVVDRYDTSGNRETLAPLSQARYQLAAATDGNGSVLVVGGQSASGVSDVVDKYDISGNHTVLAPLSMPRSQLAASKDKNGNILVIGGNSGSNTPSNIIDVYSTSGMRTTFFTLSVARFQLSSGTDGDGNVITAGGMTGINQPSAVVDRYTV